MRGGGRFFGQAADHTTSPSRHGQFFPPPSLENSSGFSSAAQSLTSSGTLASNLDFSPDTNASAARKGVLEQPIFPSLRNDAQGADLDDMEQMQKSDPLATQIWKLYSKARTQLPNAERMENLTWRMMAMSMRRAERDRNRGYERRHAPSL